MHFENIFKASQNANVIQGCSANSYDANSYDSASSYGFLGKIFNLLFVLFSTRELKSNLQI